MTTTKVVSILGLIAFITLGIVGLRGNAKLDISLGDGAIARAEGQQAMLESQAAAINAKTNSDAETVKIANEDQAKLNQLTRDRRAANQRTLNTILTWAGGIGAAIALISLGLSFAGYSVLMSLGILPARALAAPQISKNGDVYGIWMPQLKRGVVINDNMPGQMLHMGEETSELLEGNPATMIAASQSRALAAAARYQARQNNNRGFLETLELLQQKKLVEGSNKFFPGGNNEPSHQES